MRRYFIINGSSLYFSLTISNYNLVEKSYFIDLIKLSDEMKNNSKTFDKHTSTMVIPNHNYHGIVSTAHDRLGPLIEELTVDDASIYIHNPPRGLIEYLYGKKEENLIEISIESEDHNNAINSNNFVDKIKNVTNKIIGQNNAVEEISKSIWYLLTTNREKPYVIMLYGDSSLGKTEVVKEISKNFFNGKHYEKHLSMFKNNTYSDYFFGESPNRKSMGYDLFERESNLVFFDELDKCPDHFYSAFYTLFDNHQFKDATYDVDISGLFIICTSNYKSEEEIMKNLGLPIYYRIDKFIHFEDFTPETIYTITMNEINLQSELYKNRLSVEQIYDAVSPLIFSKGENGRTIKQKVQFTIEELLFLELADTGL